MSARPRFFLLPGVLVANGDQFSAGAKELVPELDRARGRQTAGWRLLGGNNRELGRSAQAFPVDSFLEEIERLQSMADHLSLVVTPTPTGKWFWAASNRGTRMAVSSRVYGRQREARYNAEQFLRALPLAVPVRAMELRTILRPAQQSTESA